MLRSALIVFALSGSAWAADAPVPVADVAMQIAEGTAPTILDVRTQEEFDAGHVPGAILIPHDQLAARIGELGAPRDLIVYCRSGRRSALVEPLLESHGFRVAQLAGSWQGWQLAGLPEQTLATGAEE